MTWEPLTGRVVSLPAWDARCAYLRLQDAARVPLTLAVREELQGRTLREQDAPGEPFYCSCCLADLPADYGAQSAHTCGETAPEAAPAPAVEHKTRTSQPVGYLRDWDGCRRYDKRGRPMRDKSSYWMCTCGEVGAGATRQEARRNAREHREKAQ